MILIIIQWFCFSCIMFIVWSIAQYITMNETETYYRDSYFKTMNLLSKTQSELYKTQSQLQQHTEQLAKSRLKNHHLRHRIRTGLTSK